VTKWKHSPSEVVKFLETCRKTHEEWITWLASHPHAHVDDSHLVEAVGDIQHHRDCIEGYNKTIELLKEVLAEVARWKTI